MMGNDKDDAGGAKPPDPDPDDVAAAAAARKRAVAIACVTANLRGSYRSWLAEPLPPPLGDLLRKLE